MKFTFMGAGSTVFSKRLLGDIMLTPELWDCDIALYDIDETRLNESYLMLTILNKNINEGRARIKTYLGVDQRKKALESADFVFNAIQVGGYDPCTIIDFEIPKKHGLRQTIADTLGIGGIFRALRTIPVMDGFMKDMEAVCPRAIFLTYTNPMGMLTGYIQRTSPIRSVGLCHSVQGCASGLLKQFGMEYNDAYQWKIAGINHQAWLLELHDDKGNDLYPEVRRRNIEKGVEVGSDRVRREILRIFGYYVTESSEHSAEYLPYYIKSQYPELIERYNIPLDEYPRRCIKQIAEWETRRDEITKDPHLTHKKTQEYASLIARAVVTNVPLKIGGNVINNGVIENLPREACVEVPCLIDASGITPCYVGSLPQQCAALNRTNVNVQLLTIEAAMTLKKEHIYHAALLDPHCAAELPTDKIIAMVDDLIEAHGNWLPKYR